MAEHTEVRSASGSLTDAAVDTVTITGSSKVVSIHNRSAATIWVKFGGVEATVGTPAAAGADSIPVPAGAVVPLWTGGGGAIVKVVGAGAEAYTVFGAAGYPYRP